MRGAVMSMDEQLLELLRRQLLSQLETLRVDMLAGFSSVHIGLADVNARLDETNVRLDETNARLDETNARLDETIIRLDETMTRLDETNVRLDDTTDRLDGTIARLDGVVVGLRLLETRVESGFSGLTKFLARLDHDLQEGLERTDDEISLLNERITRLEGHSNGRNGYDTNHQDEL